MVMGESRAVMEEVKGDQCCQCLVERREIKKEYRRESKEERRRGGEQGRGGEK